MTEETYDVIIVGGGFSGTYSLYKLTKCGFRCKLIEKGSGFGGTWYWNRYPGARVDTYVPLYELSIEELWKDWEWKEAYPSGEDLLTYFDHIDRKLGLRQHCLFNATVKSAHWDAHNHLWKVAAEGNTGIYKAKSRHIVLGVGSLSTPYIPKIKGLDRFAGKWAHTAQWPAEGIEFRNKRVGLIGTGASGVQVVQEVGPKAQELVVFQRTPNMAVPMRQRPLQSNDQALAKASYPETHQRRRHTFGTFDYDLNGRETNDDTDEQRELVYEELWDLGGFRPLIGGYIDVLSSKHANDLLYAFWRKKVCERISDNGKRAILAPETPPHPFGAKRVSLEQNYWEVMCQSNIDLVNVNEEPVIEVTATGVRTTRQEYEFDVIILATGFDGYTGSFLQIDIRGEGGRTIQEHWKDGVKSYLGTSIDQFPNLWYIYGPHGPAALNTAPVVAEIQTDWLAGLLEHLRNQSITKAVAKSTAADVYSRHVCDIAPPLVLQANSWYLGANVPGKMRAIRDYMGGVPAYISELAKEVEEGYPGFQTSGPETG
ncbi:cyclohexanone monooxygenase [Coniophora puteana RWD-64-598 SS2]|uniref:Cyclohexanone monooxygenase n=1 Tax=Coniophora puteana (strain RWD-64-598) TaxID=741705 RepID=A0A5M3MEB2_CONPW|nr:cyclohexanone monooxygenase [Coniophora puteana RWD-64-598 SS2]EIW77609.1 cyclohexanone monooxygenase [Coniophora puteana RWD-64-598 SS2]